MKKLILSIAILASFGAQAAEEITSKHGNWEVRTVTNDFTDEKSLFVYEPKARFMLSCNDAYFAAMETGLMSISRDSDASIMYRIGKAQPVTVSAVTINNGVIATDKADFKRLLTGFAGGKEAIYKVNDGRKSYDTKKLDLSGFAAAATEAGCL